MSTSDPARNPPGIPHPPQPTPPANPSNQSVPTIPISTGATSSSTASNTPTSEPSIQLTSQQEKQARLQKLIYNSSVAICIACPLIALMPPRKLDLFTFGLGVAFCTSAGYALEQRTGRGLVWHASSRLPSVRRKERERLAREREEEEAIKAKGEAGRMEVLQRWRDEDEKKVRQRGVIKRAWMGAEGEDWVERRKEREREAIEEGRGYGSLILDQLREVFRGKKTDDDDDIDDDDDD